MGIDLTGMFQNLIAAASEATAPLQFQNTFLNNIWWDTEPIETASYTVLRVNIPLVSEADVQDIGDGPIRPTTPGQRPVTISLDRNYSTSWVMKEWIAGRSPRKLRDEFVKPRVEALARAMNRDIAGLVTPTNFPNYSIITGAQDDKFVRADVTAAWAQLAKAGVPVDDRRNMFLATSSTAYGNMLGDNAWIQEAMVAVNAAEAAQQRAKLVNAYGSEVVWDQHLQPFNAGQEPGLMYHRFAIAGLNRPAPTDAPAGMVEETVMPLVPRGPRARFQVWYSPDDQGWKFHINCWWGVAVARPEMALLMQTT
jgi:hypothetical protein